MWRTRAQQSGGHRGGDFCHADGEREKNQRGASKHAGAVALSAANHELWHHNPEMRAARVWFRKVVLGALGAEAGWTVAGIAVMDASRRSRARKLCAWQRATARASEASAGSGYSVKPSADVTICCICCFDAAPYPATLDFTSRGE